jgi:hypothetical protein
MRRKLWFGLDLTTLQPYSMRELIIHVLMEVGYSLQSKETPKVFNTICTRYASVIRDTVKRQRINFAGERDNFRFTGIKLHLASGTPGLNIVNI